MRGSRCLMALALAGAVSGAQAQPAAEVPAPAPEKLAMCRGCHGIPGYRSAFPEVYSVPKLGGQHPAYLVAALQAYRDGTRLHPTMQVIARGLSEQDMAALAAYYGASAQEGGQ